MEKQTSLGKALGLLSAIGESADPAGVSVADLIGITKLSRPTAYRLLSELERAGMVMPDPRQPVWRLGPKRGTGGCFGQLSGLRRRARQEMERFVHEVGHTVHLAIRDGMDVVYLDKAESPRHIAISSSIGQRRSVSVTALGKCLVAFDSSLDLSERVGKSALKPRTQFSIKTAEAWHSEIEQVRIDGVAYDRQECDVGAQCVAAPILDGQGFSVAAISVSALIAGGNDIDFAELATSIKTTASKISVGA